MSTSLRAAVIGTGALGKEHARLYADLAANSAGALIFSGVFDLDSGVAQKIADKHRVRAFPSIEEAARESDLLSIVTPTHSHFEIAGHLLTKRKHLLIEKPMTDNASQAAELVSLAQEHQCVLQIGHVERFNPVFTYLQNVATQPRFIESH